MGDHLIDGEFQSDKYPTTPRGKIPLSCRDPMAQDLLWEYARRRRWLRPWRSPHLERFKRRDACHHLVTGASVHPLRVAVIMPPTGHLHGGDAGIDESDAADKWDAEDDGDYAAAMRMAAKHIGALKQSPPVAEDAQASTERGGGADA